MALNETRQQQMKSLLSGGFAMIPALGLVLVVVNLYFRVRGNANLATAIVLNLPISALAMIILISFMQLLFIVLSNGLAVIAGHHETTQQVRHWARTAYLVLLIIMATTLPWYIVLILIVISFAYWRLERSRRPTATPIPIWLRDETPPRDTVLRRLWLEGRWAMHRRGEVTYISANFPLRVPDPYRARSLSVIHAEIVERSRQIADSAPATGFARLATVLLVSIGTYATQLVTTPVNFAPYELVITEDGRERSGYVLDSSGSILFMNKELRVGEYVSIESVVSRQVCSPATWYQTLPQLLSKDVVSSGTVDCEAYVDW